MSEDEDYKPRWLYAPDGTPILCKNQAQDDALCEEGFLDAPPESEAGKQAAEARAEEQATQELIAGLEKRVEELEQQLKDANDAADQAGADLAAEKQAHATTKGKLTKLQNQG